MLDEAREIFAARLGIRAVVVGDCLHGRIRLSEVFVENVFCNVDVGRRRERIPRRRKTLRVVAPVDLNCNLVTVTRNGAFFAYISWQ
jgi:hypothetical protein